MFELSLSTQSWTLCINHYSFQDVQVMFILSPEQNREKLQWTVGLVSFFNGISTFVGYLMLKLSFENNSSGLFNL